MWFVCCAKHSHLCCSVCCSELAPKPRSPLSTSRRGRIKVSFQPLRIAIVRVLVSAECKQTPIAVVLTISDLHPCRLCRNCLKRPFIISTTRVFLEREFTSKFNIRAERKRCLVTRRSRRRHHQQSVHSRPICPRSSHPLHQTHRSHPQILYRDLPSS